MSMDQPMMLPRLSALEPESRIIPAFTGIHHFLSNGYEGEPFVMHIVIGGIGADREYLTGEHAYQACKARDNESAHNWVRMAATPFGPDGAKKRGRQMVLDARWDADRFAVMRSVLHYKFDVGTPMAARLLETGDAQLIEGNNWGDTFWGMCGGGQNWLGHLLMARRAELRAIRAQR